MSQKSSLQFTPNGRKLKALELKNQPKMTGFLVSSPKPSFKSGKSKKPAEFSCANSEIDKEKHGRLSDSSSERKTGTNQCRKEPVVQIDSDVSEPDTPSSDSPIFPKRPVRVAKKPLVPFKVSINTVKSDDSDNSNSGSLNKKESGCHLRNPLKEKKNFSSFNINKKTEGNVTKFSSNYNEESNVSPKERKKRFHLLPADSRDSQIDIPSSSASNAPPKRKISHEDREVKRKREVPEKDTSDINAITVLSSLKSPSLATGNISNAPSANTKEVHIQKNNAKDKKGFQQNLKIGNLPLKKRIILKSALNSFNGATSHSDIARVSSKILADHEEVKQAAKAAYVETHRSLETLLDMRLDRRLCFDLKPANECNRSVLANRYHVNFGFFMQRENYEGAVGSLRCITYNHYPNKHDLHGVLYKVIEKTTEESVIHGAQELLFKVLNLHPPIDQTMRQYYSFLLSSRPNDEDVSAPWENLVNLLEEVLSDDEVGVKVSTKRVSSTIERKKAILGFIVQLLYEDFCCWISGTSEHAESLRNRKELPLIANVLWPRSTIPALNPSCRELIKLHITAMESSQSSHIFYTQPLVKMLAAINQLTDLSLPLTFRKPNEHMVNLAREIVNLAADRAIFNQSHFFSSFGSRELQLLIPLVVLHNSNPTTEISNPNCISLQSLTRVYLKMDKDTETRKAVEKFKKETVEFRTALLTALSAYVDLFGCFKAWQSLMYKVRCPNMTNQLDSDFALPVEMFSNSFTIDDFIEDLRQANRLFKKIPVTKNMAKKSLYSSLSMYID